MTKEQKEKIEQAATHHVVSESNIISREDCSYCMQDFTTGAQWVCNHPEELGLFSQSTFIKEPVTFLLTNALRLPIEQQIALRDALVERMPDNLKQDNESVRDALSSSETIADGLEKSNQLLKQENERLRTEIIKIDKMALGDLPVSFWMIHLVATEALNQTPNDQSTAGTDKA